MKLGDSVIVVADTEDMNQRGVIRGEASIDIGREGAMVYQIVRFADGHEGAYEIFELQIVEDAQHV